MVLPAKSQPGQFTLKKGQLNDKTVIPVHLLRKQWDHY